MTQPWLSLEALLVVTAIVIARAAIASTRRRAQRHARMLARTASLLEVLPRELGPLLGVDGKIVAGWVTIGVPLRQSYDVREFEQSVRRLRHALPARTALRLLTLKRRRREERVEYHEQLEHLRKPPAAAPVSKRKIGRGPMAGALVTVR